jgi:hypothetical protein
MYQKARSDFESLLTTLYDRPELLGDDEHSQVNIFIDQFSRIRSYVDQSIRDNAPPVPEPTPVYAVRKSG